MPLDQRISAFATRAAAELNAHTTRLHALERRTLAGPLARVHGALAARERTNTRVVFLGSSTTEGVGAGHPGARYVNRLTRVMQRAYPLAHYDDEPPVLRLADAAAAPPTRPGVQGVNGGVGGTTAASYAPTATVQQVGTLNPVVVVHMIGSNDYANAVAPATYQQQITDVIAAINAACATPPVHILVHSYQRMDIANPTYAWSSYRDALIAVTRAAPTLRLFVDLDPTYVASGVPGTDPFDLLGTDNTHQTDAGYALMAEVLADALRIPARRGLPDPVVRDRFNRADGALGASETGVAWEATTGAFTIAGRKATVTTAGTHLLEAGIADVDVTALIAPATGAVPGIVFRALDDANRWGLFLNQGSGQVQLFRNDAGTNGAVAQANVPLTAGREYRVRAVVHGDQIGCYVDGALVLTYVISQTDMAKFGGYTKVGLRLGTLAAGTTFDNFAARPVTDGPLPVHPAGGSGGSSSAPANMVTLDTDQTITGVKTFNAPAAAPNIAVWQEAGTTRVVLTEDGSLRTVGGVHAGDQALDGHNPTAMISATSAAAAIVPLVARGITGQTADLFQAYDAAGVVAAHVNAAGQYHEGSRRLAPLTSRLAAAATTTATAYAGTGLSVAVLAGKVYRIRARGQYRTAATTTGIGLRLGGTATVLGVRYETTIYGLTATTYTHQAQSTLNNTVPASTGVAIANSDYGWQIEGLIRVNAAGTVTVDFISEVAGSTVTVHPESLLELQEVA